MGHVLLVMKDFMPLKIFVTELTQIVSLLLNQTLMMPKKLIYKKSQNKSKLMSQTTLTWQESTAAEFIWQDLGKTCKSGLIKKATCLLKWPMKAESIWQVQIKDWSLSKMQTETGLPLMERVKKFSYEEELELKWT